MTVGVVAGMTAKPSSTYAPPPPPPATTYAPTPTPAPTTTTPRALRSQTFGSVEVIDLDPDDGPLRTQLSDVMADAADAKSPVLVQTTAKWCAPCQKFEKSLSDVRVQSALKGVTIVRVDVDDWEKRELKDLDMDMGSVPWFFKIDAKLKRIDAISSGEWDDDVPENIAPVMRDYMAGRLTKRRYPAPKGDKM
jgi:thiol-disulfide isomerase/thioredoxin